MSSSVVLPSCYTNSRKGFESAKEHRNCNLFVFNLKINLRTFLFATIVRCMSRWSFQGCFWWVQPPPAPGLTGRAKVSLSVIDHA